MSPPADDGRPELVLAGRITGCFGIRGFLKVELAGRDPERARSLSRVFVGRSADEAAELVVEEVRTEGGRVLVRFAGYGDRTRAEALRGSGLFVAAEDAAAPPEGGWFIHDLIGCEVRTRDGILVGVIEDVYDAAGRHIWSVRGGGKEHLVPAVAEFIVSVDTGARTVVIDPPEGLLA